MKVEYTKGLEHSITISDGSGRALCLTPEGAKQLQTELTKAIEEAEKEPERSEFEKRVKQLYDEGVADGESGERITEDSLKESAAELLEIARKELVAKGEVITLGNLSPYARGFDDGKAVALKVLPRWKKTTNRGTFANASNILFHDGYYLGIKDLEKLPGFEEE